MTLVAVQLQQFAQQYASMKIFQIPNMLG